jgi:hypothetical protein
MPTYRLSTPYASPHTVQRLRLRSFLQAVANSEHQMFDGSLFAHHRHHSLVQQRQQRRQQASHFAHSGTLTLRAHIFATAIQASVHLLPGRYRMHFATSPHGPLQHPFQMAPTWAFFTGSRLGEYGQSHVTKADGTNAFDPSSTSIHVPKEWRSAPMAFICGDFVFLATNNQCIDDYRAIQPPSSILPARIWSLMTRPPTILLFKGITGLGISSVRSKPCSSHAPRHVPPP